MITHVYVFIQASVLYEYTTSGLGSNTNEEVTTLPGLKNCSITICLVLYSRFSLRM